MTPDYNKHAAYKFDARGNIILSAVSIVKIQEVSIVDSAFVEVALPIDAICKSIIVKSRAGGNWLLSLSLVGTTYITITFPLALDIAKEAEDILFYAQSSSGNETLEIMYID